LPSVSQRISFAAVSETRFVLIRHGESTWNAAGRWQGQGDPPLSERGREQVARLAAELADAGIEVIVASDLLRAAESAAILGAVFGVAPRTDARLRELDIGRWTGWTRAEIEARDRARLEDFESGAADARAGGGECRREIALRVHRAVSEIGERFSGRRIAIVAHLGVVDALLPGSDFANAEARRATAREITSNAPPASGRARRASC
jgi:probable phosphoglycerate mutase